ncbi:hypothetical protein N7468_006977 [Penicillium chermesinum]|uniref:Uncharacterized protein n=1 Tax=Penicillium chermesinum TaxID=63820 RepID=A0A9W9TK43_9EURO|nr:uncharacterized protein N7468_006977 [Penicillium chermesinum]KAJ5225752.1 hypothetical protein N7468_006977 [Penicillium chermesinum]KAJ6161031.1 hypothetical protein N7470_004427 [Penicillium chermesinum]
MEYTQVTELPLVISSELCAGRNFIVTGTNVGLGLEAARHLVGVGAKKVILAVRNLEAGEAARADIDASTGTTGVAEVWHLDLSQRSSVQSFAAKAIETIDRIDAVIENAGVAAAGTKDHEGQLLTVTVNVVNTFLLLLLLLPKLRADAKTFGYKPRVSVVSSDSAEFIKDYWPLIADDPIAKMHADPDIGMKSYPTSKLLEALGVRHLATLLPVESGGVIINAVNPGACMTTLSRNASEGFKEQLKELWARCGRTAECGSRTLLAGAVAGDDSHGAYMSDCVVKHDFAEWAGDGANEKAWNSIAKEIEKVQPGVVAKALE